VGRGQDWALRSTYGDEGWMADSVSRGAADGVGVNLSVGVSVVRPRGADEGDSAER